MPPQVKYTNVKVYGRDTCPRTMDVRARLERMGVDHEYVEITRDPSGAAFVRERAAGRETTPVLDISGDILVDPDDVTLNNKLQQKGLRR
ncbi:MAG TPA: glutaredoxin domain-containing protein [Bryobacteraceae bacterium]|nr:glutaredoxin domain-containing protein [Bryobacteraceae bacterium]